MNIDKYVLNIILDYLPDNKLVLINKEYNQRIMDKYHKAKNIIVKAIRYNKERIAYSVAMGIFTPELLRAHYILFYPEEYRWNFYCQARSLYYVCPDMEDYLPCFPVKYLFRGMIMDMSVDDILVLG